MHHYVKNLDWQFQLIYYASFQYVLMTRPNVKLTLNNCIVNEY